MGDSVDYLIAERVVAKRHRHASWSRRGEAIAALRKAGFDPKALDRTEHHYRVWVEGYGFIDFWPSSWRWHEKKKGDERYRNAGFGLESMLARLQELRTPQG